METTETELQSTPSPQPELVLNYEAQSYLREAGKWANFLSIMGFIFCGLILVLAIFAGTVFSVLSNVMPNAGALPAGIGGIISVVYIVLDVVYFFFPYYLYQFADKIKKGIVYSDTAHLTAAMGKLKSFLKYWGILTIVLLAFYALIFIIAIIGALTVGRHA